MINKTQRLYHGSTVGWLRLSGFGEPEFSYGEFTEPHSFIFLCTERAGGESAACKAYVQVHDRHDGKPPLAKYCYDGTQYAIDRYVYEVTINALIDVLDFHSETLNELDMARVKRVIIHVKASIVGRVLETCIVSITLGLWPNTWRNRLKAAFRGRCSGMLVEALGQVGFDLIRNFEPDGDGQGYGEVWALPMSKVACATPQQPAIYKLTQFRYRSHRGLP